MKSSHVLALVLCGASFSLPVIPPRAAAVELFNSRDLTGWVPMHGGEWTIEDDVLVGRNGYQKIVHYETDRLTRGYIGLQNHDHHAVVKFRHCQPACSVK
jgi:hypothetical protein